MTKISDYFKSEKLLGQKRAKSKDKINSEIKKDFDLYQTISKKLLGWNTEFFLQDHHYPSNKTR